MQVSLGSAAGLHLISLDWESDIGVALLLKHKYIWTVQIVSRWPVDSDQMILALHQETMTTMFKHRMFSVIQKDLLEKKQLF